MNFFMYERYIPSEVFERKMLFRFVIYFLGTIMHINVLHNACFKRPMHNKAWKFITKKNIILN